jgi:uncharacterized protein
MMGVAPVDAAALVAHLDDAGIGRAVVLSVAYSFGSPNRAFADEESKVRAENDWTARQVERFPERLMGFCGLNPLRGYALEELARCAADPVLRRGLKLHFGNSVVDYRDPQHVEQLRRVFEAANGYGMAILVHLRASLSRRLPYGRDAARAFLEEILPAAPDVPVQVAHLAGTNAYASDPPADEALSVFIEAIARGDRRAARLLFDVATAADSEDGPEALALIARRIRELGVERVLYGSDAPVPGNSPRESWATFRRVPLSEDEWTTIAGSTAPYLG